MAGRSAPVFVGAWLLGAVAAVSLAQAQSGQGWSDPPPDLNAGPLTLDSGSTAARSLEAQDWPDEAARRRPPTEVAQPSGTPDVNETGSIQTAKEEAADADAARASAVRQRRAQQAAARKAREKQVALARAEAARQERAKQVALAEAQAARKEREEQAEKARKVQEARVAARARKLAAARERRRVAEQDAEPQPTVYEVMRLRTLVFPDGRTLQVLTYPDQEALDLSLR
jgi:hypothetical protein